MMDHLKNVSELSFRALERKGYHSNRQLKVIVTAADFHNQLC